MNLPRDPSAMRNDGPSPACMVIMIIGCILLGSFIGMALAHGLLTMAGFR